MLRSLPRAASGSAPFRVHPQRIQSNTWHLPAATCPLEARQDQRRYAGIHAISNPTLAGIEKRWEGMPPQQQADLWMALRDRMKVNWHEMTLQEKKAGTWHRIKESLQLEACNRQTDCFPPCSLLDRIWSPWSSIPSTPR